MRARDASGRGRTATWSCTARAATRPCPPRRTGRPARRRVSCWTLVRAQTSTACVAIASGCARTGRGMPARLTRSAEVGVDHAARSVAPERALLPRAPASRLESHSPVTTWSSCSRWWRPEWASPRFPNRAQSAPGGMDPHHRTRGRRPSDLCRHVRRPTRPTRHHRADRDPEGHGVVPHVPPGSRPTGCVRWRHRRTHATRPNRALSPRGTPPSDIRTCR
jgi:hypothetical protein